MNHVRALGLAATFVASTFLAAAPQASAATDTGMPTCAAGDSVVWENTKSGSKVYHVRGDKYFGNTKSGKYACKSVADAAGYHAAPLGSSKSMSKSKSGSPAAMGSPAAIDSAAPGMSPAPDTMASGTPGNQKHHHHHGSGASAAPSDAPSPSATST